MCGAGILILFYSTDKIDMKECSACGQIIPQQAATEQPHIHEATTWIFEICKHNN